MDEETIAAVATPPGASAIAIVRVCGPQAFAIAQTCARPVRTRSTVANGALTRCWIVDPASGERLDDALVARFAAPHSATGEDVVEFHVHGGAGVVASCLALVLRQGARLAQPGEFTKRAFLNGRIDLAQAEAVADLIAAESGRAAAAAAHRLAGELGAALQELRAETLAKLVEIEAHVDYPDEVPSPDTELLARLVARQHKRVEDLLRGASAAQVLRDGVECAIVGPPNAGKSSLLNALVRAERAIVSEIPGTTRDIIEDRVAVDGVVLRLRDTAGLRVTTDAIEAEGVARARAARAQAQLLITVIDASRALGDDERDALAHTDVTPHIVLANKLDLGEAGLAELCERLSIGHDAPDAATRAVIAGSVRWPDTVEQLRRAIATAGWGGTLDGGRALVAGARQIDALTRAREALARAQETLRVRAPIDLVSTDLREAVSAYGEVTGDTVTDEVLEGIFSRFCVGK